MITITNNSFIIPQGDTGAIQFAFKDHTTGHPLILTGRNYNHEIVVILKDNITPVGNPIKKWTFEIKNNIDDNDNWVIFDDSEIKIVSDDSWVNESYKLYKVVYSNNTYAYKWRSENRVKTYDFKNSSINLVIDNETTKNLEPKTYYLEISHHIYDNDNKLISKNTLMKPTDFIVKGALE